MKSICSTGLVLFATLGWAAGPANAQSDGYGTPSLLPLPSTAPVFSNSTPASYNYYEKSATASEAFGSSLTNRKPNPSSLSEPSPSDNEGRSDFEQALHSPPCDECDACNTCNSCNSCCGGRWFGAAGGLVMTRNRANPYWTTFQTNNNPNQLMNTQNAGAGWSGGGQITVGYRWCGCNGPALALTYWGVAPMFGYSTVTDQTGNINTALSTPIDLGGVTMNNGILASHYFDNAAEQRIWRHDRFNNVEINLIQMSMVNTGRLQMGALAGFRYFRFSESLTYGSVAFGSNFGDNGGADEAYMGFNVVNNLFGAQIGAFLNYNVTDRFGIFFIPKFGIFGNQMNCQTLLYTGDAVNNPTYNISAHKSDVSVLGELDSGLNYSVTPNIRAYIGYRVVAVSNVALADNQVLPFLADTAGFAQVKQNGDLILHGVMTGVAWAF